jgi:hypothetical protein
MAIAAAKNKSQKMNLTWGTLWKTVTENKFLKTECISQIVPEGRELLCRLKNEVDSPAIYSTEAHLEGIAFKKT